MQMIPVPPPIPQQSRAQDGRVPSRNNLPAVSTIQHREIRQPQFVTSLALVPPPSTATAPTARARAMQRIVIIGSAGAGKSTLGRQLGALLGLEVSHLDTLFWKPGWVEPSHVEWRKLMEQLVQRDAWILEGNYGATFELRFAAADTIIFLDFPRMLCLWRAVKRRFQYRKRFRPDRAPGCREKLDLHFLKWIWAYAATRRPSVIERIRKHAAGKRVVVLHNPAEVRRFLKQLAQEQSQLLQREAHG